MPEGRYQTHFQPLGLGDLINAEKFKEITLSIFETGKFDDIKLGRDGNALLIDLVERPTIDEIFIEGNKQIKTDALLDGLKKSGISEGSTRWIGIAFS